MIWTWRQGCMAGSADGWMAGWMDRQMSGWIGRWVDGSADGWMAGWIGRWVDGWMDGWLDGWVGLHIHRPTRRHIDPTIHPSSPPRPVHQSIYNRPIHSPTLPPMYPPFHPPSDPIHSSTHTSLGPFPLPPALPNQSAIDPSSPRTFFFRKLRWFTRGNPSGIELCLLDQILRSLRPALQYPPPPPQESIPTLHPTSSSRRRCRPRNCRPTSMMTKTTSSNPGQRPNPNHGQRPYSSTPSCPGPTTPARRAVLGPWRPQDWPSAPRPLGALCANERKPF